MLHRTLILISALAASSAFAGSFASPAWDCDRQWNPTFCSGNPPAPRDYNAERRQRIMEDAQRMMEQNERAKANIDRTFERGGAEILRILRDPSYQPYSSSSDD